MFDSFSVLAGAFIRELDNNSTILVLSSGDNINPWISFGAQVIAVIVGGLITLGASYIQDRRQRKNEEIKQKAEDKERRLKLRNEAYIEISKFLYIPTTYDERKEFTRACSNTLAYGSQSIKGQLNVLIQDLSRLLDKREDLKDRVNKEIENIRKDIFKELMDEKL
jgi:hypothetical protein